MGKATIYTYTIIRSSTPEFADRVPYCSAILENPDGSRFAALIAGYVDGMDVRIGQSVAASGTDDKGRTAYSF